MLRYAIKHNWLLSHLTYCGNALQSLVGSFELREYNEGMVIAWAGEVDDCMYVVKSGQCLLTTAAQRQAPHDQALPGATKLLRVQTLPGDRLEAGARHGEQALLVAQARTTTLVASRDSTQVSFLPCTPCFCQAYCSGLVVCGDQFAIPPNSQYPQMQEQVERGFVRPKHWCDCLPCSHLWVQPGYQNRMFTMDELEWLSPSSC